jgi:predicted RNA-binding Zn-ribbon protein involved in translation (DUF1610 family)
MRGGEMRGKRSHHCRTWGFEARCPSCRGPRRFLVTEPSGGARGPVLARCHTCTRLVPVAEEHRLAGAPVPPADLGVLERAVR